MIKNNYFRFKNLAYLFNMFLNAMGTNLLPFLFLQTRPLVARLKLPTSTWQTNRQTTMLLRHSLLTKFINYYSHFTWASALSIAVRPVSVLRSRCNLCTSSMTISHSMNDCICEIKHWFITFYIKIIFHELFSALNSSYTVKKTFLMLV